MSLAEKKPRRKSLFAGIFNVMQRCVEVTILPCAERVLSYNFAILSRRSRQRGG